MNYNESYNGLWNKILEHHARCMRRDKIKSSEKYIAPLITAIVVATFVLAKGEYALSCLIIEVLATVVIYISLYVVLRQFPGTKELTDFNDEHLYLLMSGEEQVILTGYGSYYIPERYQIFQHQYCNIEYNLDFNYDFVRKHKTKRRQAILTILFGVSPQELTQEGREIVTNILLGKPDRVRQKIDVWIRSAATIYPYDEGITLSYEELQDNIFGFKFITAIMHNCYVIKAYEFKIQ